VPRIPKAEKQREHIERVAWEIYANRYKPGKRLDKDKLWDEADKIVRSPIKTTLFASNRPLIGLEKRLWEPLLAWANDQAMLSLLGLLGNLGLIIAVATYIGSEKQRRDAEVLNAWQTITSAYGQSGSGGRIQALEFINASPGAHWRRKFPWVCAPLRLCVWEPESLAGINLSVPDGEGVFLAGINLQGANLNDANLQGANLNDANLQGANLSSADLSSTNLSGADLNGVNLNGADLSGVNLSGADLSGVNLNGADLRGVNLNGADLSGANLSSANLREAKLIGADLSEADLSGATLSRATLSGATLSGATLSRATLSDTDLVGAKLIGADLSGATLSRATLSDTDLIGAKLIGADLSGATLSRATLQGAVGLTPNQLTTAKLCRTTLPEAITLDILDTNRDCAELGRVRGFIEPGLLRPPIKRTFRNRYRWR
jgi:uncharacterized protein YjbI with pentapeptide repeats